MGEWFSFHIFGSIISLRNDLSVWSKNLFLIVVNVLTKVLCVLAFHLKWSLTIEIAKCRIGFSNSKMLN